ncbi:hypothetical protein [Dryocola clanedunensis]|nr:hypothetical protein [Cedecea sulfonylureivorans]
MVAPAGRISAVFFRSGHLAAAAARAKQSADKPVIFAAAVNDIH